MLTIPVWDLLNSYDGDSKNFAFEGEIFDWYYDDIQFLKPLEFKIKLLVVNDGIHAFFTELSTEILYENKKQKIHISDFERIWKSRIDLLDPDDIYEINMKNATIDLAPVIREEIIMAFHSENM